MDMLAEELFLGITSFQFCFVLFQWLVFKRREYFYYLLHILTIILYASLLYFSDGERYLHFGNISINILYVEKSLLLLTYGFYICFGQLFLNLPLLYPRINRYVKFTEVIIFSFCIVSVLGLLFTSNFVFHAKMYTIIFTLVFISSLWVTGYFLLFEKYTFNRLLAMSGIWIAGGIFVSTLAAWHSNDILMKDSKHMLFLQVGVLVELFVLNSALVYKIKKIQDDNNASQQKIIKELEENRKLTHRLNNIRDEISMDLHDELGGGLSSIRLLTELIKRKTINKENIKPLNKISESSNELVQKINEIVWALNISNDSLENLFAYIREYTMNFFDATNINCLFIQPEKIPDDLIEGHYRRAIFLAIKEALNNIVKHAEATEVEVKMTIDQNVEIEIRDNGKGIQFPLQNLSHNGLQNMNRRIKSIQGSVRFLNHHGTTVAISFPLKGLLHKSVI